MWSPSPETGQNTGIPKRGHIQNQVGKNTEGQSQEIQ